MHAGCDECVVQGGHGEAHAVHRDYKGNGAGSTVEVFELVHGAGTAVVSPPHRLNHHHH